MKFTLSLILEILGLIKRVENTISYPVLNFKSKSSNQVEKFENRKIMKIPISNFDIYVENSMTCLEIYVKKRVLEFLSICSISSSKTFVETLKFVQVL